MRRTIGTAGALAAGYLLGTVPSADVAGRFAGVNVRSLGTGNPGAANLAVFHSKRLGLAVGVVDVGKGWLAAEVGRRVSPTVAHAAAVAAVVGHVFPVWSRGRGGKGVATSYGAVLGVFPAYALPDLAVASLARRVTGAAIRANDVSTAVWVVAAVTAWRLRLPNLWGPAPTVALPLGAAASGALITWRFRHPAAPVPAPAG